jgi:hypothetical protein
MKNLNYTIGAIFSDIHDKISNKVFDCVGTSISDRSFNSKEGVINQVLDHLKTQIYEKY